MAGLYFHIPFCKNICAYCDFFRTGDLRHMDDTLQAMASELRRGRDFLSDHTIRTIYFGGGTPSLVRPDVLQRLIDEARGLYDCGGVEEITVEANPDDVTEEYVAALRHTDINRVSLGVQSFDSRLRGTLGRDCSQAALEHALDLVATAKFPHWNCDLIYAIPGQDGEAFRRDLDSAVALGIDHLSCYSLTPEEGARLADSLLPDEEESERMWKIANDCGLPRYEISNYAKSGGECRHNMNVWRGGRLRGFGPSAAGFDGVRRTIEPASLAAWLRGDPPEVDEIPPEERLNEIFAVNLRTVRGWTPELWSGVPNADPWESRLAVTQRAAAETFPEWFDISPERITLTNSGLLFWNSVAETIL